ncbi:MAG: hypothetical protein CME35_00790 [Gramella sp.]|nr:hypothetical protein [Christiangramia sp.]
MADIQDEVTSAIRESGFQKPGNKDREPPKGEKDSANYWKRRIEMATITMGPFHKKIKEHRQYVLGEQHDDGSNQLVRANLVQALIRKAVNSSYARNPQFSIRPTENVALGALKPMRLFGKTAEIVLNRVFEASQLKRRAKACLRAAKTTGIGWAKIYYQTETEESPLIIGRIKDARDDLEQLEYLKLQIKDPEQRDHKARLIREKKDLLKALEHEKDVIVGEGLIVDVIDSANMIIDISTIRNFDDYVNAPFIAEGILMTVADAKRRWGEVPPGTKMFVPGGRDANNIPNVDNKGDFEQADNEILRVYEIHDRNNKVIRYLPEGAQEFLQDAVVPPITCEQWFPYFPMGINIIDGQFYPLSEVALVKELQDEHNSARTRFAQHRDIAIPHWVGKRAEVNERDAKQLQNAEIGEISLIEGQPGQSVKNSIEVFSPPPVDPAVYSTDHTERDIERVSGQGEVTQPKSNRSRTLGEAQLLSQETGTQISADTDEIEDWFERVAQSSLEILLQTLTKEQVVEIAGPEAIPEIDEQTGQPSGKMKDGSVWPDDMSRSEIFNNLKIQIQAGSSGKPDREQMAQTWAQFLLPRITELIQGVGELRTNGQEDLADSLILVAQETMRRMDERFDIHEFLPREDTSEQDPDKMKAMQEQMELQAVQMEQLKADLEETKSKTVKNLAQADKFKEDAEGDKAKEAITAYKAQEEADRSDRQQMHEQRRDMMDAEMKFSDMQAQDQRDDKEFRIKERQMNKPVTK